MLFNFGIHVLCLVASCMLVNNGSFADKTFNRLVDRLSLAKDRLYSDIDMRRQDAKLVLKELEEVQIRLNNSNENNKVNILHGNKNKGEPNGSSNAQHIHKMFNYEKNSKLRTRRHVSNTGNKKYKNNSKTSLTNVGNECHDKEIGRINKLLHNIVQNVSKHMEAIDRLEDALAAKNNKVDSVKELKAGETDKAESCMELYTRGKTDNGIYGIYPANRQTPVHVYCDQETDGGGWIVFQRRKDGSVYFYRNWADYADGFGDLEGEFWLGNYYLSILTATPWRELRVDLKDFENDRRFAKYDKFRVGTAAEAYGLTVGGYSGNAGDSLSYHNNQKFSTKDKCDGDRNYAKVWKGGWWYKENDTSSLNGEYFLSNNYPNSVFWFTWLDYTPLQYTEMKFR